VTAALSYPFPFFEMTKIPSHQEIKKPLLALAKRKQEVSLEEAIDYISDKFNLRRRLGRKCRSAAKNRSSRTAYAGLAGN
jgi:hypothetical protein